MAAQNLANSICLVFFGWAYDYNPSLPFGGAVVFYWVVIYYTYKLQWIVTPNGSKRSGAHSSFRLVPRCLVLIDVGLQRATGSTPGPRWPTRRSAEYGAPY